MAKDSLGTRQERDWEFAPVESTARPQLQQAVVDWQEACDAVAKAEARMACKRASQSVAAVDLAELDALRLHMTECYDGCLRHLQEA